jgi:hypothetical protein
MATSSSSTPSSNEAQVLAPAIWNPTVATLWSILLSPAFGAYIHMRNWHALSEPEKAATARGWFIVSLAVFCVVTALQGMQIPTSQAANAATGALAFVYFLVWYFSVARDQAKYVKKKFGKSYQHKGWLKPLALAIGGVIALAIVVGLILGLVHMLWSVFM